MTGLALGAPRDDPAFGKRPSIPILHRLDAIFFVEIAGSSIGLWIMPVVRRLVSLIGALTILPASMLLQCTPLFALEPPSKPFLDKNSFYLSSASFEVHFANDGAGHRAASIVRLCIGSRSGPS